MIEIEDKIISKDLFEKKFVCDLQQCKGACCVEGESGAPLSKQEVIDIKANLPLIEEEMSAEGKKAIKKNQFYYLDDDKEEVTSLINGKECVFVFYDQNNIAKCSIESAFRKNKIKINKPISCHLYPIRAKKYDSFEAINIHNWHICKPACSCGINLNIPVFKFLKEPIIRAWGEEFYSQLDNLSQEFFQSNEAE